jgi:DNA-binding NtrC family response regulator
MTPLHVLICDDEKELRESLGSMVRDLGHSTLEVASGEEALEVLRDRPAQSPGAIQLCLLDVNLPGRTGLETLREIRAYDPSIIVILITAHGSVRDAVEAMRDGAYNYLEKPVEPLEIEEMIHRASEARNLVRETELSSPRIKLIEGEGFIGETRGMRQIFEWISRLGQVSTSVLIRGENGTGKELVARAIHLNSPRKDKPFVAINCGAIPEGLVESEFFGHEKGAFTGADKRHLGKFQFAEGGTLFLDEVGELTLSMQVKLLRVLQERKFTPVGSHREIRSDVRIIAATHRNLEELLRKGLFREDLFYRLNVMPMELPPLRERLEDLPKLVEHFIEKFNHLHDRIQQEREIRGITNQALSCLHAYSWPGNIRELENAIERAFVFETTAYLTIESLPETVQKARSSLTKPLSFPHLPNEEGPIDFHEEKERFEKEFILLALKKYGGRINQTSTSAGIPKNTLLRKMRKYGIQVQDHTTL